MGNQREIRQVEPRERLGVAIGVRDGCEVEVERILAGYKSGHFYTYLAAADEERTIHNMDVGDCGLGRLRRPTFIIQSGGKMWCGYDAFREHIATVSRYLTDALFLVGDEYDYIDEFRIADRTLQYRRVHSGYGMSLDEYLRQHDSSGSGGDS